MTFERAASEELKCSQADSTLKYIQDIHHRGHVEAPNTNTVVFAGGSVTHGRNDEEAERSF